LTKTIQLLQFYWRFSP